MSAFCDFIEALRLDLWVTRFFMSPDPVMLNQNFNLHMHNIIVMAA
jgi:hypothetical protein